MSDASFRYCADSPTDAADDDDEYPIEGVTYTMSEDEFFTFLREYILGDSPITPRNEPREARRETNN